MRSQEGSPNAACWTRRELGIVNILLRANANMVSEVYVGIEIFSSTLLDDIELIHE